MTEIDILKHAKEYLDKLAEGIDPLTGAVVSDTDVVRQTRISRCLTYVSDVLGRVIARGGLEMLPPVNLPVKKQRLPAFTITKNALEQVMILSTPVTITEFGKTINAQIDPECMEKLKTASLLEYLEKHGFLEMRQLPNGKSARQPTQIGLQLGIGLEERQGAEGPYTATVYDARAQSFLLKHMDEIVEINTSKYNETVDTGALQGQPWTREQEAQLRDLFLQGIPLPEIARTMQRSTSGIQARLQRLGLIQSKKRNL